MRDFQTKANQNALPDSNSAEKYGASEVNSLRSESKTAVSRTGLTLAPQDGTGEDTTQLAQSLFINGASASSFQAAGTANAITLTPITGASGLLLPPDYLTLDGGSFRFFIANNNTAATTFSIGQTGGTQFGTKKILDLVGAELAGGELVVGEFAELLFDQSADGGAGAGILISAVAAAPSSKITPFLITDSTDTALATQASGGSQIGNTALNQEIPTAGTIRITVTDLEWDETSGAIGQAAMGLKIGTDVTIYGVSDDQGGTSFLVGPARSSVSVAGNRFDAGVSYAQVDAGDGAVIYTFDIAGHGMSTGTQDIKIFMGDKTNGTTGDILITGTTNTARFFGEILDAT